MPQLQQPRPIAAQFAGQPGRRHPLRDAAEDQEQLGAGAVGLLKGRPGKRIKDPPAGLTPVVQDRVAMPAMHRQFLGLAAPRTTQPLGMEHRQQFAVAGLLIQEVHERKVHAVPP
jgi:hypothetical protein